MKVNIGGSLKTVTAIKINVAGSLRTVTRHKLNVGGALKVGESFITTLTASISDASPSGFIFGTDNNPVTTNLVTVTPAGGAAPYTYSWARISGLGTANSASSASTRFSDSVIDYDTTVGLFRCTVTDSQTPAATVTVDADATFNNFGPLGL